MSAIGSEERDRRADALSLHRDECADCQAAAMPVDAVRAALGRGIPAVDPAALSARTLAAVRPELMRRARRAFWWRIAAGLAGGLVPLPLVLAINALFLNVLYALLSAFLPAAVAQYLVLTHVASLILVLGGTYAAIPVLVDRATPRPA